MNDAPPTDYRLEQLEERWSRDKTSRLFLQLAEEYRRRRRFDEALEVLETGLSNHPGYLSARVALGRCRLDMDAPAKARDVFVGVIEQDPTHLVGSKLLIESLLRLGEGREAHEALIRYRLLSPPQSDLEELEAKVARLDRSAAPTEPSPEPEPPAPTEVAAAAPRPEPAAGPAPEPAGPWVVEPPPAPSLESLAAAAGRRLAGGAVGEPFGLSTASLRVDAADVFGAIVAPAAERAPEAAAESELSTAAPGPAEAAPAEPSAAAAAIAGPWAETPTVDADLADEEPASAIAGSGGEERPSAEAELPPQPIEAAAPEEGPIPVGDGGPGSSEDQGAAPGIDEPEEAAAAAGAQIPQPAAATEVWAGGPEGGAAGEEAAFEEPAAPAPPERAPSAAPLPSEAPAARTDGATTTLGDLYLAQGHPEEAAAIFRRVLVRDPGNASARQGLLRAVSTPAVTARELAGELDPGAGLTARKVTVLHRYLDLLRQGAHDVPRSTE